MRIWHSGRESIMLDEIIAGHKTIEGRLNRGKFAKYSQGDIIYLRRDFRDEAGNLRDGKPDEARVVIIAIRNYSSFHDMARHENFKNVIPSASDAKEAADVYNQYYSTDDQKRYGVLAIEIKTI